MKPKILVFSGYGLNCEEETKFAFDIVGGNADIIHINDVIQNPEILKNYNILAFPGGFSYGDDTGSGNAFAHKIRNHLWEEIEAFVIRDTLVIGICNGFQILTNLGLLPALEWQYGKRQSALLHNESARYIVRWVDVKIVNNSPWLQHIDTLSVPIAHGEGRFYASKVRISEFSASVDVIEEIRKKGLIALQYVKGEITTHQDLPYNPNGTMEDIAGITNESGKVFGLMPHPERAIFFTQLPHWTLLKEQYLRTKKHLPKEGPGLQIFKNAIRYFQ